MLSLQLNNKFISKIQILHVKSEGHGSDPFVLDKLWLPQGFPFYNDELLGLFKSNHKQTGTLLVFKWTQC